MEEQIKLIEAQIVDAQRDVDNNDADVKRDTERNEMQYAQNKKGIADRSEKRKAKLVALQGILKTLQG